MTTVTGSIDDLPIEKPVETENLNSEEGNVQRGNDQKPRVSRVDDAASKRLIDQPKSSESKVPKVPRKRGQEKQCGNNIDIADAATSLRMSKRRKVIVNYNEKILWQKAWEEENHPQIVKKDTRPSIIRSKRAAKAHKPTPFHSHSPGPSTTSTIGAEPSPMISQDVSMKIELLNSSGLSGLLSINPGGAHTVQQSDSCVTFRVLNGKAKVNIQDLHCKNHKPFELFFVPKDAPCYIKNMSKSKKLVLSFHQNPYEAKL